MDTKQSNNLRRMLTLTACLAVVVCLAFFMRSWWVARLILRLPSHQSFSGPIKDGYNAFGMHGPYGRTIDFSPDNTFIAYAWSDNEFMYPPELGARPRTLTESLHLLVRHLDKDGPEFDILLDSIDLRPDGVTYFLLEVNIQTDPDSRYVAAIVARRLVLVDALSGQERVIEYEGEFFGSFSWVGSNELVFSTYDGKALTFWRYNIQSSASERITVYTESSSVTSHDGLPPDLHHAQWSPNGQFVTFTSFRNINQHEDLLLNTQTGETHILPFSLYRQCWKPDSTAIFVQDGISVGSAFYLVDPLTGESKDLTAKFADIFGVKKVVTLVSPMWTPDGKSVVLYSTDIDSTARRTGYVIQLEPFEVLLSTREILRWSPIPDWYLLQGEKFSWIDSSGENTASIQGWVNYWTWSHDGKFAAYIAGNEVKVITPELPSGVK